MSNLSKTIHNVPSSDSTRFLKTKNAFSKLKLSISSKSYFEFAGILTKKCNCEEVCKSGTTRQGVGERGDKRGW